MKRALLLITVMTANVFAVEKQQLMSLINEAANKRESAYVEERNKIVEFGTNALPLLIEFAVDEVLPWQQQLVARVCYERIARKEDIERLLATDWYAHPNFDPKWNEFITGPEPLMGAIIVPELKDAGLWYYCLEVVWKMTNDNGKVFRGHPYAPERWAGSCTSAIRDNPEERVWFLRVCADLFEITPPPPRVDWLRSILFREKTPDAVPLLFRYFIDKDTKEGPWFRTILEYADSRSADVLEGYIAEHPDREFYKEELAAVRARPVPPSAPETFRLGTNIIKRTKQP